ncbi:MAG TPA: nuclear transport factor 2 family protein [Trichocoleus sp.]
MATISPFMTVDEIILAAQNAWLSGDADRFAGLFDQIGQFVVPGNEWVGQGNIRDAFQEYIDAYEVINIEVTQIIQEGDRAFVEWRWSDRERGTSNVSQAEDAVVIETQAGRIIRWREYTDTCSR